MGARPGGTAELPRPDHTRPGRTHLTQRSDQDGEADQDNDQQYCDDCAHGVLLAGRYAATRRR
ncbi:hypothetical protein DMP15_15860 [Pseudonocardia sp. UM4_GMWB1]